MAEWIKCLCQVVNSICQPTKGKECPCNCHTRHPEDTKDDLTDGASLTS